MTRNGRAGSSPAQGTKIKIMFRKRLSKQAQWLLYMISAQTDSDKEYVNWIANPDRDSDQYIQELITGNYLKVVEGDVHPTPSGRKYFTNPNPEALFTKLQKVLPKNPKFSAMLSDLTDTALVRFLYEALGEIGRRGNPEKPESVEYWQGKIDALKEVIKDATPDTLWERHNNKK